MNNKEILEKHLKERLEVFYKDETLDYEKVIKSLKYMKANIDSTLESARWANNIDDPEHKADLLYNASNDLESVRHDANDITEALWLAAEDMEVD